MQGLELSRRFYEAYGAPMIEREFGEFADRIAVGLVGEGSECFGFDDDLSTDHDFEPGFCLWITDADERQFGFRLERAYAKLPREFMGYRRLSHAPLGGDRHGVFSVGAFYRRFLGAQSVPNDPEWWMQIPSFSLAAACNGEVFRDDLGAFSAIREELLAGYPEDVRRKKLASELALAAQAGCYNYERCVRRGERGSAQLAVTRFAEHILSTVYLLNRTYEPFYKWVFRGMRQLPRLGELEAPLISLLEGANDGAFAEEKLKNIRRVSEILSTELRRQGLSGFSGDDLGIHAQFVQNGIADHTLRNRSLMD